MPNHNLLRPPLLFPRGLYIGGGVRPSQPPQQETIAWRRTACTRKIEVVGASKKSLTDAIKVAVARAAETVKNMSWFEVVEQRGAIREGKVAEYQVTVKIGFRVDE